MLHCISLSVGVRSESIFIYFFIFLGPAVLGESAEVAIAVSPVFVVTFFFSTTIMLPADCRVKIEMDDYGEGACGEASESLVRGRTQREPAAVEKDDFSRIVRSADCPWSPQDGDRHGGAFLTSSPVSIKKPRYTGKADWEAFHAQFELLADAAGWSVKVKALQLAMCLADDALSCLLLLSPEDRGDYVALVGALRRRFGDVLSRG